ncbi:DUF998 domain-containing protein [Candidatus Margulisiibacteriota bacterium]
MRINARTLILCGALSPIIYIVTSVIGGLLLPEYSHIKHSVSDLLATGAPNKILLDSLMFLSNILTIIGCSAVIVKYKNNLNIKVKTGISLILATGLLNIVSSYIFRLPLEGAMTISGMIHITIVILVVLLTMTAILLIGFGIHKYKGWSVFKNYSIITFLFFLLMGLLSPVIIAKSIPLIGLFERLAVFTYFQWVIVLFAKLYKYKIYI